MIMKGRMKGRLWMLAKQALCLDGISANPKGFPQPLDYME